MGLYIHSPYVFMAWCLIKHRIHIHIGLYLMKRRVGKNVEINFEVCIKLKETLARGAQL